MLRRMPSVPLATAIMLVSVALAVVLLSNLYDGGAPVAAQTSLAKPNFVFILTDDMRYDDLEYMLKTKARLGSGGMTFTKAFVTTALCCPSRATIMRGQYTHNTGVWFNPDSPSGG